MAAKNTSAMYVGRSAAIHDDGGLAGYKCGSCGSVSVVTAQLASPSCLFCGSDDMETAKGKSWKKHARSLEQTASANTDDIIDVECVECSAHMMLDEAAAKTHVAFHGKERHIGKVHCPVCSTALRFDTAGFFGMDDPEETLGDEEIEENLLEERQKQKAGEHDGEGAPAEEPKAETQGEAPVETEEAPPKKAKNGKGKKGMKTKGEAPAVQPKKETAPVADPAPAKEDPAPAPKAETAPAETEDAPVDTQGEETEETAALPTSSSVLSLADFATGCVSFVRSGPKLYAMMEENGNHVLVGTKEVAGDTSSYENALNVACGEGREAVSKVLANNGFALSSISVGYDKFIMDEIDRRDSVMQSEYKEKLEQLGGVMEQSLGIAMGGIHRGLFADMGDNPMVVAMTRQMTASVPGLDEGRAREMIATAMEQGGDEYVANVRAKALDLMSKSDDTRNELAELIQELRSGGTARPGLPRTAGSETAKAKQGASLETRLRTPARKSPAAETAGSNGGANGLRTTNGNGRKTLRVDEIAAGMSQGIFASARN